MYKQALYIDMYHDISNNYFQSHVSLRNTTLQGGTKSPKFRCPCRSYVFEEAGDHGILQSWGFPESWGYPNSWLVFVRETPIEMDDLGVPPFMETPIYTVINGNPHIYHLSEMRKHDP